MIQVNLCDTCPITDCTTCSVMELAYQRQGFEGMEKCEVRADVERMIEVMKSRKRGQHKGTGV